MKKVAFIIPMLQPYRISFYEKIVELNPNIHFIFFHGLTNHSARPSYEGEVKFETNSFTPRLKKIGPYGLYINDGLMSGIKEFNPDAIILFGNPGVITNQFIVRCKVATGRRAKIEPGCEVIVPEKPDREPLSTQAVVSLSTTIASTLATLTLLIVNVFK